MGTAFRDQEISIGKATSTFCDTSATTQMPDISGATMRAMSVIFDAGIVGGINRKFNAADHVRRGLGGAQLSPEGIKNNTGGALFGAADGTFLGELFGELTLKFRNRNCGSAAALANTALLELLGSSMEVLTPAQATTAVFAAGADAGEFVVGTGGGSEFTIGAVVSRLKNNVTEFFTVTDVATDTITVTPFASGAFADTDVIRHCVCFYPKLGVPTQRDVFLTFEAGGLATDADVRFIAAGCRVTKIAIAFEGESQVLSVTVLPATILPDHTNASVAVASELAGAVVQITAAEFILGASHKGVAAPVSSARTALALHGWSADLTFGVVPSTPALKTVARATEHEISSATCVATLVATKTDALADVLRLETQHNVVLGCGPTGAGEGFALVINSASADDGGAPITAGEGERMIQTFKLRAVDWAGADASTALAAAPFVLAYPMGA